MDTRTVSDIERELLPRKGGAPRWCALAVTWVASILSAIAFTAWIVAPGSPPSPQVATSGVARHDVYDFYNVYNDVFKEAKYIDLTIAFAPDSPVWNAFGSVTCGTGRCENPMEDFIDRGDKFEYGSHGFTITDYHLPSDQVATQLDPPAHWNEYGATISDVPATFAVRPLAVVDISGKVRTNPGYHATKQDVLDWEEAHGRIPEGAVVFFRSDWSHHWAEYVEAGTTPDTFPGVSLEALKFIHLERSVMLHGHETLDVDMSAELVGEAWLMHNNFAQAEGLTNLHLVAPSGCLVSIGFAKPEGGTGGYARYIAICPPSWEHGQVIAEVPGAPLPVQPYPLRRDHRGVMVPDPGASPTKYCAKYGPHSQSLGCTSDGKPTWLS